MRRHTFTPHELFKLKPGEVPGTRVLEETGKVKAGGGLEKSASFVFTFHLWKKKSFC